MIFDANYFKTELDSLLPTGDVRTLSLRKKRWIDYWNFVSDIYSGTPFPNFLSEITLNFCDFSMSQKFDSVLEIGCGNGVYTDILADNFRNVTALDLSPSMLEELLTRSKSNNKHNIKTVCIDFNDFKTEEKYDLVFASLCPGVNTVENIERLEYFSKGQCVLITVARDCHSSVHQTLTSKLTTLPLKGLIPDASTVFNYLYLTNKNPSIIIKEMNMEADSFISLEKSIELYKVYYEIFGLCDPMHHKIITEYLTSISKNGLCEEASGYTLGMIVWQAKH